jgi:glyoxylase-like metal-dependent hydrolase (beta-lactamase superfamily II)
MTLIPIAGRASYMPGANNLGVIATGDGGAIAVDTGIDKDTGRALRKALDAAGLELRAIISTHHHADHVGGNSFLLRHYPEADVYATAQEAALIRHPLLEPIYLSGGALPPAAMRTKFVLAPGSPVHHEFGPELLVPGAVMSATIAGVALNLLGLPGHSMAQVGVLVDGVCFAADSFFGAATIAKHSLPYAHDIAMQLASLDALAACDAAWFLPGHGELAPREGMPGEVAANRAAIQRGTELVAAALAEPGEQGTITARVLSALERTLGGVAQFAIFSGAVGAQLAYLEQQGRARLSLEEGRLVWSMVG